MFILLHSSTSKLLLERPQALVLSPLPYNLPPFAMQALPGCHLMDQPQLGTDMEVMSVFSHK